MPVNLAVAIFWLRRRSLAAFMSVSLGIAFSAPAYAGNCPRSDSPKLVDAFSGVLDRQLITPMSVTQVLSPKSLRAAVILSQNTKEQLAWSQKMTTGASGLDTFMGTLFAGKQAVDRLNELCRLAYDPKYITDSVMQPLVRRFKEVAVISHPSEFAAGNYDMLILIDVFFNDVFTDGFLIGAKYQSGTTIAAYFIDRSYAEVGKVQASKKRNVSRSGFMKDVVTLRAETLGQYQADLRRLLGPEPATAPAASSVARSPVERLKAVDDLLRQNLITPAEAASKKAEILEGI